MILIWLMFAGGFVAIKRTEKKCFQYYKSVYLVKSHQMSIVCLNLLINTSHLIYA